MFIFTVVTALACSWGHNTAVQRVFSHLLLFVVVIVVFCQAWLCDVERSMRWTLKEMLKQCRLALKKNTSKRDKWVKDWAGQVSWAPVASHWLKRTPGCRVRARFSGSTFEQTGGDANPSLSCVDSEPLRPKNQPVGQQACVIQQRFCPSQNCLVFSEAERKFRPILNRPLPGPGPVQGLVPRARDARSRDLVS